MRMGVRAVVAAGWAVDDRAASTFATKFYDCMLSGGAFGDAVQMARNEGVTVIATAGKGDEAYVRDLGASEIVDARASGFPGCCAPRASHAHSTCWRSREARTLSVTCIKSADVKWIVVAMAAYANAAAVSSLLRRSMHSRSSLSGMMGWLV